MTTSVPVVHSLTVQADQQRGVTVVTQHTTRSARNTDLNPGSGDDSSDNDSADDEAQEFDNDDDPMDEDQDDTTEKRHSRLAKKLAAEVRSQLSARLPGLIAHIDSPHHCPAPPGRNS